MATQRFKAKPIFAGYEWRLRLSFKGLESFPDTARFVAQVRTVATAPEALATLKSEEGTVVRTGLRSFDLVLPGDLSAGWNYSAVVIDVVRVDQDEPVHLGFVMTIPVKQPVTRGL